MKALSLFLFYLTLHLSLWARAEYRVFELTLRKGENQRVITSTLDPLQYPGYYPLLDGETVEYQQTWMCRGRTDNQLAFCPNPQKAQIPEPPSAVSTTP
ncbi:MAG: hypothetical protein ACK5V3_11930 [Bdellovibrionales bacterium]